MCRVFVLLAAVCVIAHGAQFRKFVLEGGHRIAGGQNADIKELPYQLSLETYGWNLCGATIISEHWALTAAHCVYNFDDTRYSVRAGSNTPVEGGSVHQLSEIVVHPKYNSYDEDYDYALLRVEQPFPLGEEGVNSIKMADSEPRHGQMAVVSGWGALSSGGPEPSQLQKVTVPIIDRSTCGNMYADYEHHVNITERMLCAGLRRGGKDSCERDSGGPLTVDGILVGVVSWGIGCAHPNRPGVYANVANQRDWIRQVSGV